MKVVEAGTDDGAIVDSAELQQLAELGLPTTFASAQVMADARMSLLRVSVCLDVATHHGTLTGHSTALYTERPEQQQLC